MPDSAVERDADVIVVGAGPAGSTTAYHLAKAGLDVLLLEKTAFPREKVCGDGLTPRATKQLVAHGHRHLRGGRLAAQQGPADHRRRHPARAGLARARLATRTTAWSASATTSTSCWPGRRRRPGARLHERCNVGGPIIDERTGRITGVHAKLGEEKTPVTFHAPLVVAADGNSTRLSLAMGLHRREDRPMGVAVRTYFTSPRARRRLPGVLAGAVGPPRRRGPAAARLRLDLRHGRRHVQRRPRHPQHLRRLQGAGLARGAQGAGAPRCRRTGATPRRT